MDLDDVLEPKVMIAVAVTAAVASPPVRKVLRKGLVYGLAGLMTVGDRVAGAARNIAESAQNVSRNRAQATEEAGQTVPAATS